LTQRLSDTERETLLPPLVETGWEVSEDGTAIAKTFRFDDFTAAFAFMTRVALYAEKWDHHPDWSNSYNRVTVSLTTHDAAGLSGRDIQLARKMDTLA
jgi:4a-hydroxytetrahydrobiopterin dehydratase